MKLVRLKDKNNNNIINKNQLELQYPVNKVEIFYDNLDHSNWLGFTWELVSIGRTPVGLDVNDIDFNTIGKQGGNKKHRHNFKIGLWDNNYAPAGGFAAMGVSSNNPAGAYKYSTNRYAGASSGQTVSQNAAATGTASTFSTTLMESVGDTDLGTSLQPYEVVAYWRRIA